MFNDFFTHTITLWQSLHWSDIIVSNKNLSFPTLKGKVWYLPDCELCQKLLIMFTEGKLYAWWWINDKDKTRLLHFFFGMGESSMYLWWCLELTPGSELRDDYSWVLWDRVVLGTEPRSVLCKLAYLLCYTQACLLNAKIKAEDTKFWKLHKTEMDSKP